VGFATYDTTGGDFDSGGDTISLGTWYHVAASYDRGNLANPPTFYINGTRFPTTTLVLPSGTAPPLSGTGYIANSSANNRSWNGLIDDLRVYDRILTDTEIQLLASAPPANFAPVVFAGTNQTIAWPTAASLFGTVTDDGNPNPPGVVVTAWSQLSGPGSTTFANSNLLATTATFSAPGYYLLQLSANDGQAESVSSVAINSVVRPTLSAQLEAGSLQLSWPTSGWLLQTQTNALTVGLSSNWVDVPGSTSSNAITIPIDPVNGSVFFRLVTP
jgi:hypothetical protein